MSKTSTERDAARTVGPVRRAASGPAMGARWSAVYFDPGGVDPTALAGALDAAVDEVETQMSSWRPDSDLCRLNRAPLGRWVPLPAMLTEVLDAALTIGRLSEGAFDVGVGDLVRAWGFGAGSRRFDAEEVARFGGHASFDPPRTLELDAANRRARRHASLNVDLCGIAKGYGVDRMAAVMRGHGVASHLVGIDGELRAGAAKPDGRRWAIGQEKPTSGIRELLGVIDLVDAAVATSGDYRHVVEIGDRRFSHTFDPRTGAPLDGDLAQVSVVAETCLLADAWATALLVAGATLGPALARKNRIAAVFVGKDGRTCSTMDPCRETSGVAPGSAEVATAERGGSRPATFRKEYNQHSPASFSQT